LFALLTKIGIFILSNQIITQVPGSLSIHPGPGDNSFFYSEEKRGRCVRVSDHW